MMARENGVSTAAVAAVVVVLLVVAGGGYYLFGRGTTTVSSAPSLSGTSTSSTATSSTTYASSSSTFPPSTNTSSTCTTTASSPTANYADLFGNASAMSVSYSTSDGKTVGLSSYSVIYAPGSGSSSFKVNTTMSGSLGNGTSTFWVNKSDEVLGAYYKGTNYTGAQAESFFEAFAAPFGDEASALGIVSPFLDSPSVSVVNSTTVDIGTTAIPVKTYQSDSNFTISQCTAQSLVTTFLLQMGTLPGTKLNVITYWNIVESLGGAGGEQYYLTLSLKSITPA